MSTVFNKSGNEVSINLAPTPIWTNDVKGLKKELIEYKFIEMKKPTEISKCRIKITDVNCLSTYKTNYLNQTDEFIINIGSAITPVDVYVELILKEMLVGEKSHCFIKTKTNEIDFILELQQITDDRYYFQLNSMEIYKRSLKYKENGVQLFKEYPLFAQEYFCKSAKLLLSIIPFKSTIQNENLIDIKLIEDLYKNVCINLAACLHKQKRNEEIIHVLEFIDLGSNSNSINCSGGGGGGNVDSLNVKGVYRKSLALYNIKEYDKARTLLETIKSTTTITSDEQQQQPNDIVNALLKKINEDAAQENIKYSNMVKKMFT